MKLSNGGAQTSSEKVAAEPIRKKCKWGRWATNIEAAPESPGGTESQENVANATTVAIDPGLGGELQRKIQVEEMVVAKLPLHAFYSVSRKSRANTSTHNILGPLQLFILLEFTHFTILIPFVHLDTNLIPEIYL